MIRRGTSHLKNGKHLDPRIGHLSSKCAIAMASGGGRGRGQGRGRGEGTRNTSATASSVTFDDDTHEQGSTHLTMREMKGAEGTDVASAVGLWPE